jgi:hypothetical protein
MEDLSREIAFLKSITKKDLEAIGKHSKESVITYEYFRDDSENFTDTEPFEYIEEMGLTLQKWVGTVKKIMEVYPQDFADNSQFSDEDDEVIAPIKTTPKKPRVTKTVMNLEERARMKEENKESKKAANLLAKIELKRAELVSLKQLVVSNAEFKERIGQEMNEHLKIVGLAGLGNKKTLPPELEIIQLNEKIKFYKNLIRGDKDDFKAIAKRIGLDFRKSKPRKKKEIEPLSGLGRQKQSMSLWDKFVVWFND